MDELTIIDRLSGFGGGLSEYVVAPESSVYKVPDNVSLEVAGSSPPIFNKTSL